jgi:hypothetical protein
MSETALIVVLCVTVVVSMGLGYLLGYREALRRSTDDLRQLRELNERIKK